MSVEFLSLNNLQYQLKNTLDALICILIELNLNILR